MENKKEKKFSIINWIGTALTAGCFIYLFVIYLVMFVVKIQNENAWNYFGSYAGKLLVCIFMFAVFAVAAVSLLLFTLTKKKGKNKSNLRVYGAIIAICAIVSLILIIIFWSLQGQVFDGNGANPESTVYRIVDLIISLVTFFGVWMTLAFAPSYDTIKELKRKKHRI